MGVGYPQLTQCLYMTFRVMEIYFTQYILIFPPPSIPQKYNVVIPGYKRQKRTSLRFDSSHFVPSSLKKKAEWLSPTPTACLFWPSLRQQHQHCLNRTVQWGILVSKVFSATHGTNFRTSQRHPSESSPREPEPQFINTTLPIRNS